MFTQKDLAQIRSLGIDISEIERQINVFRKGIDYVTIVRPAIHGDGIEDLKESEKEAFIQLFGEEGSEYSALRFVPASGAASRMFKTLYESLETANKEGDNVLAEKKEMMEFFKNLPFYPFYQDLEAAALESGIILKEIMDSRKYGEILELILTSRGLNYGALPKGLLKFHAYPEGNRTAIEEHYEEASMYLYDRNKTIHLHFTVSPEHLPMFLQLSELLRAKYLEQMGINVQVDFSVQKPSTDTIAVDKENEPFRLEDGKLLFRPGGHGALIDNLNDLKETLVFIGNIDNVSPDHNKEFRVRHKKLLGGILIHKMKVVHSILKKIDLGEDLDGLRNEIIALVRSISPVAAQELTQMDDTGEFNHKIYSLLNRPMRVCGMVRNVGEPGGGPFWVINKKGNISKQIVESSQINMEDPKQHALFMAATHFNPVDMVCCLADYNGNAFNLHQYVDPDMAFIAYKSQGGKELKALERPGLWNGSMAGWLTWFVEVPLETFSPVKTVFDLVRSPHLTIPSSHNRLHPSSQFRDPKAPL